MTTDSKKPSEQLKDIIAAFPKQEPGTIRIPLLDALPVYLDAEHERRAAFEKDVLERLAKVEQSTPLTLIDARSGPKPESTAADGIFAALMSADPPTTLGGYAPTEETEEP